MLRTNSWVVCAVMFACSITPSLVWAGVASSGGVYLDTPEPDVWVFLVPMLEPGDKNPNDYADPNDPELHSLALTVMQATFSVEVWVNDLGDLNTGVVSAYFDVAWWSPSSATAEATALNHDAAFGLLPEGAIDNPNNQVINLGGSDPTFQGQGIDEWARVAWIDFTVVEPPLLTCIYFEAGIGAGEVGVLNRTVGEVEIVGCCVPEPTALSLLVLGGLLCLRRRRRS